MKLVRAFYHDIRNLRHHVDADSPAVAEFHQLVSERRVNIPQDNPVIAGQDFLFQCLLSRTFKHALGDIILIPARLKLFEDILCRSVPADKQKGFGWKETLVQLVADKCPARRHDNLSKHHQQKRICRDKLQRQE